MNELPSAEDLEAVAAEDSIREATNKKEVVKQKADEVALLIEMKRLDRKKHTAYTCGERWKASGAMRVSPYYEDAAADAAFFAGFDGAPEPTLDELLSSVL
jgi:hypothetical protein